MKLSPAQLRMLRNLDVAVDLHGNSMFEEWEYVPGWFTRSRRAYRCNVNTFDSLLRHGLIDKHPDWYLYRISPAGADELRQRGYVVYTQHDAQDEPGRKFEPGAWKDGAK